MSLSLFEVVRTKSYVPKTHFGGLLEEKKDCERKPPWGVLGIEELVFCECLDIVNPFSKTK